METILYRSYTKQKKLLKSDRYMQSHHNLSIFVDIYSYFRNIFLSIWKIQKQENYEEKIQNILPSGPAKRSYPLFLHPPKGKD